MSIRFGRNQFFRIQISILPLRLLPDPLRFDAALPLRDRDRECERERERERDGVPAKKK